MIEGYKLIEYHIVKKSCSGCDHYVRTMMKSGRQPVYRNACKHPDSIKQTLGKFAKTETFEEGISFGENNRTPDWCPVGQRPEGEEP
jgi:hypothetical protein